MHRRENHFMLPRSVGKLWTRQDGQASAYETCWSGGGYTGDRWQSETPPKQTSDRWQSRPPQNKQGEKTWRRHECGGQDLSLCAFPQLLEATPSPPWAPPHTIMSVSVVYVLTWVSESLKFWVIHIPIPTCVIPQPSELRSPQADASKRCPTL